MTVPAAPVEAGSDKILFMVADNGSGTLVATLLRAFQKQTLDGETVGELGVYATSGRLENGHKALTGGARVALYSSSLLCQGVLVKADVDNAANIYVGKSDVTADKVQGTGGFLLQPGESVGVPCRDVTEVYIVGTGTDGVMWLASLD